VTPSFSAHTATAVTLSRATFFVGAHDVAKEYSSTRSRRRALQRRLRAGLFD